MSEKTGREVDYSDIEKGYETVKGKYVMLTHEELESVEPGKSRTIDIEDFVELAEIDPIYFEKPYYVVPQKGAEKPYALLRAAMEKQRAGRDRALRHAHQAVPRRDPRRRQRARARDAVLRRRDPRHEGAQRPEAHEGRRQRAAHRGAADRQPHGRVEAASATRTRTASGCSISSAARARARTSRSSEPEREERKVVDLVEALQRSLDAKAKARPRGRRKSTTTKSTTEVDCAAVDPEPAPGRADCPQD